MHLHLNVKRNFLTLKLIGTWFCKFHDWKFVVWWFLFKDLDSVKCCKFRCYLPQNSYSKLLSNLYEVTKYDFETLFCHFSKFKPILFDYFDKAFILRIMTNYRKVFSKLCQILLILKFLVKSKKLNLRHAWTRIKSWINGKKYKNNSISNLHSRLC